MTDRSGSVILEEIITREEQIQNLDVGFAELVITAAWYIWWERRQLVHGETVQRPSRSAMAIAALTKNYKLATKKTSVLRQGWKKPPEGKVMVNVDAGYDENGGCGSVGSIIRDCSGGVLIAAHSSDGRGLCAERGINVNSAYRVQPTNRSIGLHGTGTNYERGRLLRKFGTIYEIAISSGVGFKIYLLNTVAGRQIRWLTI